MTNPEEHATKRGQQPFLHRRHVPVIIRACSALGSGLSGNQALVYGRGSVYCHYMNQRFLPSPTASSTMLVQVVPINRKKIHHQT